MVKDGNNRVIITLTPRMNAKLQYLCDELGLKKTAVLNLALDTYHQIIKKGKE